MFKFSRNTLSIGKIWNNSFVLYKQTLGKVWYLAFLAALLPSLSSLWQKDSLAIDFNFGTAIYQLVAILVVIYLTTVILHYIFKLSSQSDAKIGESLRLVLTKYLIIIGAALLVYLVLFILLILILAAIFGINHLNNIPGEMLLAKASIGLAIWLVMAVFIGILCTFIAPSIIFDDKGCFAAIKRSLQLVWGNWWRTFIIFLLPVLIIAIISILLEQLVGNLMLNILVTSLFTGLTLPFMQSIVLLQFNDLKLRKK
jgi:hypothetical protein